MIDFLSIRYLKYNHHIVSNTMMDSIHQHKIWPLLLGEVAFFILFLYTICLRETQNS